MADLGILGDAFEQALEVGKTTVKKAKGEPSRMAKIAVQAVSQQLPPNDRGSDLKKEREEKKRRDQQRINEIQRRLAVLRQQQKQVQKVTGEERQRTEKVQEEVMKGSPEEQKEEAAANQGEFKPPTSKPTRGLPFSQKSQTEKNRTVSG